MRVTTVEAFLMGFVAMGFLVAGVFFVKFWRETRDTLFLAFAVFFLAQAGRSTLLLEAEQPNVGQPWTYFLHIFTLVLILGAILKKNYGRNG